MKTHIYLISHLEFYKYILIVITIFNYNVNKSYNFFSGFLFKKSQFLKILKR